MSRILSALVGICILAFAQARPAYICEVLFDNFCPTNAATCANDPVLHFNGNPYGFENFNLVSFGNMYAASGDVEGRTAVRNNVDLTAYSIGYQLRTAGVSANSPSLPYTMVVGGDAKWHGGAVYPDGSGSPYAGAKEYIFVGGDFTNADSYLQLDRTGSCPTSTPGCLNADFDAAQSYYRDLSAAFGTLTSNTNVNIQSWGTIEVTCNSAADAQYVVNLTPTQFSSINYWSFTGCNPNSGLIVNIQGAGSQVRFWGATQTFFRNQKVLYNVVPSSSTPSVRVEVSVNGNLLAPSSNYNQPGMGVFIGQVIVANVQETLQINLIYCQPPPPSNNHNNSNNHLCPAWETDCAGLDLTLSGSTYSFRDINVISFGDFNANTGDIEGRLAVQGNAHFGYGYSIGYELQTSVGTPDRHLPFSLIVGHDLFWGSGALYPQGNGIPYPGLEEDMFVGGTFTTNQSDLIARRTGSCATTGCLETTFNNAKSCYSGYSSAIASQPDNVVKTIEWSGLMITCNDASATAYYVSLSSSEFSSFTYTTVGNCNFQANWFINIVGTDDVSISGGSFPGVPGGIVYNVVGCGRTITVHDTTLSGHFLAPCSYLNQPNGLITGKVVAGNVMASLQINRANTCPQNVTVQIPVVVQIPSVNTPSVVFYSNAARVNDIVAGATVVATHPGNAVDLNSAVTVNKGQMFTINAHTADGRAPDNTDVPTGSASALSMAVASVVALIALAF